MDIFKIKNKWYHKHLTKLGENKVLQSRPRATMFVASFLNFKSYVLSHDLSGDCMISCTEVWKYYC